MGFVARTIFWLGLVYSAMPLDFGSLLSDQGSNPLARCALGPTDDCRRRVEDLRRALDIAATLGLATPADGDGAGAGRAQAPRAPAQSRSN